MSKYSELDEAIMKTITATPGMGANSIVESVVNHVLPHMTAERSAMHITGLRLRALCKKGKIHFSRRGCDCTAPAGWFMTRVGK